MSSGTLPCHHPHLPPLHIPPVIHPASRYLQGWGVCGGSYGGMAGAAVLVVMLQDMGWGVYLVGVSWHPSPLLKVFPLVPLHLPIVPMPLIFPSP